MCILLHYWRRMLEPALYKNKPPTLRGGGGSKGARTSAGLLVFLEDHDVKDPLAMFFGCLDKSAFLEDREATSHPFQLPGGHALLATSIVAPVRCEDCRGPEFYRSGIPVHAAQFSLVFRCPNGRIDLDCVAELLVEVIAEVNQETAHPRATPAIFFWQSLVDGDALVLR